MTGYCITWSNHHWCSNLVVENYIKHCNSNRISSDLNRLSAKGKAQNEELLLWMNFQHLFLKHCTIDIKDFSRLTSCFSSSERALSIWSNNAVHLARCAWAIELSKWPTEEFCEPYELFSWLDENSLDNKLGNSVWITARTLFLLRRNAANIEWSALQFWSKSNNLQVP